MTRRAATPARHQADGIIAVRDRNGGSLERGVKGGAGRGTAKCVIATFVNEECYRHSCVTTTGTGACDHSSRPRRTTAGPGTPQQTFRVAIDAPFPTV
ncbi:hypothetical protein E2C01_085063 [Portunus trituberculatus]|uniref:Uncharacterized protein n=1 Tax=Portunus trituberculatus TaxID=210409 RepID=A0A5B7J7W0_PORTR|nr:hypothetical protein [Portunus trituberculatus]